MKKQTNSPHVINSVSELHRLLSLPKPQHPLVSFVNLADVQDFCEVPANSFVYNFYSICIKNDFAGKLKYGQNYYDFDAGVMSFFAPGQVISTETTDEIALSGSWLIVHPDFLRNYGLAKTIKNYGYFSYAVNEALHLSEKEARMITGIMRSIEAEYNAAIDRFSQNVIVAHIELLLNYCDRFYNRQFITRQTANHDLLTKMETLLSDYFDGEQVRELGLPTVQYVAKELNVSPNYLSDVLRAATGQTAQQHIHNRLIEKAKEILTTTSLSIGETAFRLGFEYPQSFNKLFKNKSGVSPLRFRNSFH